MGKKNLTVILANLKYAMRLRYMLRSIIQLDP